MELLSPSALFLPLTPEDLELLAQQDHLITLIRGIIGITAITRIVGTGGAILTYPGARPGVVGEGAYRVTRNTLVPYLSRRTSC